MILDRLESSFAVMRETEGRTVSLFGVLGGHGEGL